MPHRLKYNLSPMRIQSTLNLMNPMNQFCSINDITESQRKNPKIKQILRNFHELNQQKQRTDAMVIQCQSIQNMIQTKIEKEKAKSKQIRIKNLNQIKPVGIRKVQKPYLDDKGQQRLQIFKEHIRKEL